MQPSKHHLAPADYRNGQNWFHFTILQAAQLILTMAPFKGNKEMHRSVTSNANFLRGRHQRNIC